MKLKYCTALVIVLSALQLGAQDVSLDLQKAPDFSETEVLGKWKKQSETVAVGFASSNERVSKDVPPAIALSSKYDLTAWRGEKVSTQILISTKIPIDNVNVTLGDFKSKAGLLIGKNNISTGFVQYVMADEFAGGCGYRKSEDFDSSYQADIINTEIQSISVGENSVQPVWVSVAVPAETPAGVYSGVITVNASKKHQLKIDIKVIDRVLPASSEWKYDLDLWQHPAAIARIHKVSLWSDEHFSLMKKYYTMLAEAGQKNITASIVNEPWGHQTYDDYPSLIKWIKKADGSWEYDYSLFDKYIEFVMSCGIKGRISCYSMVPWKIAFLYYDESLKKEMISTDAIGSEGYNSFWKTMLEDFTKHLKEKKWFDKTYIAMDERPMAAMQSVIRLLKSVDKDWKIALAGEYHEEIEKDIYNYCIASKWEFPKQVLESRKQQGKVSTWYTCCTEKYPNAFSFSPPAEMVWMGWYTAATGMEGYLRWAYNSWPANPIYDSRFTAWPSGDTYMVYPGPLTSIRFEKIIEGVQDYEKISILRKEYSDKGDTKKMQELEEALKQFQIPALSKTSAKDMLAKTKNLLNL